MYCVRATSCPGSPGSYHFPYRPGYKNLHASSMYIYLHAHIYRFYAQFSRHNYVTPTSYLELISSLKGLIGNKRGEVLKMKKRYEVGLQKLAFASEQVTKMQKELEELQPKLVMAREENAKLLVVIEKESADVEARSKIVRKDEEAANEKAAEAQALKDECESELAEAIPALEAALAALNTLKPSDITIVKTMKQPPDGVKLVMAAVCVMRDVKPDKVNDPAGNNSIQTCGHSKNACFQGRS